MACPDCGHWDTENYWQEAGVKYWYCHKCKAHWERGRKVAKQQARLPLAGGGG